MNYPLEELISMLELLVSNIPELGHPPVVTTDVGVRFWLCPELGDATSGPALVSESGPKAGGFPAFLDFDLDPPCTKVPSTTCTMRNRIRKLYVVDTICLGCRSSVPCLNISRWVELVDCCYLHSAGSYQCSTQNTSNDMPLLAAERDADPVGLILLAFIQIVRAG